MTHPKNRCVTNPCVTRRSSPPGWKKLVADFAPRLFALVEEAGERVDGRIVAWGMAFEDRAEVVAAYRSFRGRFRSPDTARQLFARYGKVRLVWYNPEAASQDNDSDLPK